MGRVVTPTFRVELETTHGREVNAWHGRAPSVTRLREYCERTEESYKPNGCNAHVAKAFPHLPVYAIHKARVIRQATGAPVAFYAAPLFRLV